MAYDIGPRIGIDGEREFRQQLKDVNAQIKNLGAEMKVVTTAFGDNANSMEALTAKNEVLRKTIDAVNDQIAKQRKFLDDAREKFGDNAENTQKWERALNESQAQLNQLQNELRQNERRLEGFGDEAKEAGDAMDEAGRSALDFGDALKASFVGNLAAEGAKALFSALVELGGAMVNLDEETREYRQQQGMLKASFKANKLDATDARKAYEGLYRVIGDSGQATEAAQLLGNLAKSSEDIDFWTRMAAGSWGKFGEALPINNLIEAANEAVNTGESVSALDDAINWSGGNAEEFKEQLAACATQEERLSLITDTLSGYLDESADAFYDNNKQIVAERDAALNAEEALGILGDTVSKVKTKINTELGAEVVDLAEAFSNLVLGAEDADERFEKAIDNILTKVQAKAPAFADAGVDLIFSVLSGLLSDPEALSDTAFEIVNVLIDGLIKNAPELTLKGLALLGAIIAGIYENIGEWLFIPGDLIKGFIEGFDAEESKLVSVSQRLVNSLTQPFTDAFAKIKERWNDFLNFFSGFGDYNINWGPSVRPSPQATGLNYVPYDGFLASLHEGEMILTRKQAEMIRANGVNNTSLQSTAAALVNGIQAFSGVGMDTPVNITLVTPDGDVLATYMLPSLVRIADASGTPITAQ